MASTETSSVVSSGVGAEKARMAKRGRRRDGRYIFEDRWTGFWKRFDEDVGMDERSEARPSADLYTNLIVPQSTREGTGHRDGN